MISSLENTTPSPSSTNEPSSLCTILDNTSAIAIFLWTIISNLVLFGRITVREIRSWRLSFEKFFAIPRELSLRDQGLMIPAVNSFVDTVVEVVRKGLLRYLIKKTSF